MALLSAAGHDLRGTEIVIAVDGIAILRVPSPAVDAVVLLFTLRYRLLTLPIVCVLRERRRRRLRGKVQL